MTIIADTFTDANSTLLSAHGDGAGHTWSKASGSDSNDLVIQSNAVQANANGAVQYYSFSAQPAVSDYKVRATMASGGGSTSIFGLLFRFDPTTGNGYWMRYNGFGPSWLLGRLDAYANTTLDSTAAGSYTTIEINATGSSLNVLVDGSGVLGATDATYTATGFGGLATDFGGNPGLSVWDEFEIEASSFTGGAPAVNPFLLRSIRVSPRRR